MAITVQAVLTVERHEGVRERLDFEIADREFDDHVSAVFDLDDFNRKT